MRTIRTMRPLRTLLKKRHHYGFEIRDLRIKADRGQGEYIKFAAAKSGLYRK